MAVCRRVQGEGHPKARLSIQMPTSMHRQPTANAPMSNDRGVSRQVDSVYTPICFFRISVDAMRSMVEPAAAVPSSLSRQPFRTIRQLISVYVLSCVSAERSFPGRLLLLPVSSKRMQAHVRMHTRAWLEKLLNPNTRTSRTPYQQCVYGEQAAPTCSSSSPPRGRSRRVG